MKNNRVHHAIGIAAFCLFNFLTASLRAQSADPKSDTVEWRYSRIENKVTNETVVLSGKFISYGGDKLKWVQNGLDREYVFVNNSASGAWSDLRNNGEIVYRSTCDRVDGTVTLSRTKKGLIIELDFVKPDKNTPHFVFPIDSFSKR
ncbi:hypothetical protein WBG78_15800 [Chryseolinea sp. T2]|uniref:hypothetical protein n=1 Tax=Chryseolinea sp. T2 TaxID=3129255 RepID=UPI0030784BD7